MDLEEKDLLIGLTFEDENSQIHEITERLSAGGQGVVYRTKDANILIKLKIEVDSVTSEEVVIEGEQEYKAYVDSILDARIVDVPKGVQITRPILFLKSPQCGYIMRTLDNMVPIKKLMFTTGITDPKKHYRETGGLKRRIELLAKFAKMFALLHSRPLVYADISEGNLFVSGSVDANEAWLIDADNLKHQMYFSHITGTEGYQAPEVAQQLHSNTTFSDVYSFAIVAYKVLTYRVSPFLGALKDVSVEEDEDAGWDDGGWGDDTTTTDPFLLAEQGKLPWVDDPKDDSNRDPSGIPIGIVASPRMFKLFNRTFSQKGRENPASRPTMEEWYDVLNNAVHTIVSCSYCGHTHFFTEKTCPFCQVPMASLYVGRLYNMFDVRGMLAQDEELGEFVSQLPVEQSVTEEQISWKILEISEGKQILTRQQLFEMLLSEDNEILIEVEITTSIILRNVSEHAFILDYNETRQVLQPYTSVEIPLVQQFELLSYIYRYKTRKLVFKRRG